VAQAADRRAVLKLEGHDGYWRLIGGPVPPGADAITLGSLVSVRAACASDEHLARHEAVHVRQWRDLGVVRFVLRYLGSYLRSRLAGLPHRSAYRRIPLEIEAEWVARRSERSLP